MRNLICGLMLGVGAFACAAYAQTSGLAFNNTVTGEKLNFDDALPEGRDTDGVKKFMQTGVNPYTEDKSCLKKGEQIFLSACSGCHGHIGEGKIGPGLNDAYWTYPENETDVGLFSTIFGGAKASMGPQYQNLKLDEMLLVMAWVRHLYKDDVKQAPWFSDVQKKNYKPYQHGETFGDDPPGSCKTVAK
ncbi:cytochrome c(L), periplasmic [Methylocystis heyeri]|uniref:Cytochrome c-L n=1 Tax=Methylocystis heyeri TaxID=391905 RepID=A0A6B8KCR4_9HYPH|nr:cytochrome c(L), periplasmic [Methylocystis heyeri]QGM46026.1 cytochrome c(L), periplasmic [Methylocystis heyeri]